MTPRTQTLLLSFLLAAPPALAASPPPIPIATVTQLPNVQQNPVVLARDGTYSTEINGVSYWSFNDTALSVYNAQDQNFFSNSLSWSTSLSATNGIALNKDQTDSSNAPTQFVPFSPAEAAFNAEHAGKGKSCQVPPCGENLAIWPGPIVYNPATQQVIIPFNEIVRGGPISGFKLQGAGISIGTINPDGSLAMTRPVQSAGFNPTLLWQAGVQPFTSQAFLLNGYYYAYGNKNVWVATNDLLARVPIAKILNLAAWTYYAGNNTWSPNVADAATTFQGSSSGSSVFFDKYLNEWVAVFSNNYANTISFAVANAPEGPWSAPTLLATGEPAWQNNYDYAARAHPEFSPDNGRTLPITYVHDTGFLQQNLPTLQVTFTRAP